jgi:hypothetical protein
MACITKTKAHIPLLEELLDGLLGILTLRRLLERVDSENRLQGIQLQTITIIQKEPRSVSR